MSKLNQRLIKTKQYKNQIKTEDEYVNIKVEVGKYEQSFEKHPEVLDNVNFECKNEKIKADNKKSEQNAQEDENIFVNFTPQSTPDEVPQSQVDGKPTERHKDIRKSTKELFRCHICQEKIEWRNYTWHFKKCKLAKKTKLAVIQNAKIFGDAEISRIDNNSFTCKYCNQNFTSRSELCIHRKTVHNHIKRKRNNGVVKNKKDTESDEKISTTTVLITNNRAQYSCCGTIYKSYKALRSHHSNSKVHGGITNPEDSLQMRPVQLQCDFCGLYFVTLYNLRVHLRNRHWGQKKTTSGKDISGNSSTQLSSTNVLLDTEVEHEFVPPHIEECPVICDANHACD